MESERKSKESPLSHCFLVTQSVQITIIESQELIAPKRGQKTS